MRRITLLSLLVVSGLYAGKGEIPLTKLTTVVSPVERSIVLFNGKEEIMILSNDVQATSPTSAWEIVPLPSMGSMDSGDISWIRFADSLLNHLIVEKCPERTLEDIIVANNLMIDNKFVAPHDLYIWKMKVGYSGFIKWLKDTLAEMCVDEIPEKVQSAIYYYINHGIKHWGINQIDVDMEIGTVKPLVYRFKTRKPFYPLRMSAASPGSKTVMVYMVSRKKFDLMEGEGFKKFGPFKVKARYLTGLYPDLIEFFGVDPEETLYFMGIRFNGLSANIRSDLPIMSTGF